jgi:membrane protein
MLIQKVLKPLKALLQRSLFLCLNKLYITRSKRYVSCYAVGEELFRRLYTNDIIEHAYGMAFNFTLAIFPAIISVFTLIPHIPIPMLAQKIIAFLQEMMPLSIYEVLAPTIQDTLSTQRKGLLSLGFLATLYLATNGMMSLIKTFDLAHKDTLCVRRGYFKKRGIAALLTLMLALVLCCAMVLLIVGNQLFHYVTSHGLIASKFKMTLILGLRLCTIVLILLNAIACIYYVAPSVRQRWPFFSFGSLIATLLSLVASFGFSYYVKNFANYNRIYGSLGIFIALMSWLFVLSAILLVGFELNTSIDVLLRKSEERLHGQPTDS